jgi:hypothetical protein
MVIKFGDFCRNLMKFVEIGRIWNLQSGFGSQFFLLPGICEPSLSVLSPRDLAQTLETPPPAVMLHELLLALLGFTGDFVLDAPPARRRAAPGAGDVDGDGEVGPTFRLAPDITFLQPSER